MHASITSLVTDTNDSCAWPSSGYGLVPRLQEGRAVPLEPIVENPFGIRQVQMRVDDDEAHPAASGWMAGMSVQLAFAPALSRPDLLAAPVEAALRDLPGA